MVFLQLQYHSNTLKNYNPKISKILYEISLTDLKHQQLLSNAIENAQKKVEVALKAKEEAEAIEAEGAKLSAEAKQAELNGDSDAGAKAQKAAQVLDEAAKKAQLAASLASEAARAMESLKQFETPGEATDSEEKETVTK